MTTNWDDYFERECGAIPIVTAEDFAFYNLAGRKVFKIHGSISNYGSIIATAEDYTRCYNNLKTGLIGSHLKSLLATTAVVGVPANEKNHKRVRWRYANISNSIKL